MKTFSDDTLREAREKLLSRGVVLRDLLQRVQTDLRRAKGRLPVGPPKKDEMRDDDEVLQAVEKAAFAELVRIEHALEHTEDDTFGLCEECGREIEAARFVAIPDATHCKACGPNG